jgi:hypothetical protein
VAKYAVMNFCPSFCPACGARTVFGSKFALEDWENGCARRCNCGLNTQLAPTEAVLDAAERHPHGDMKRYAQQEGHYRG